MDRREWVEGKGAKVLLIEHLLWPDVPISILSNSQNSVVTY